MKTKNLIEARENARDQVVIVSLYGIWLVEGAERVFFDQSQGLAMLNQVNQFDT